MSKIKGRVTLPSENNFLDQTRELLDRWGADAIRDSDGTKLDESIKDLDANIYTTYFVARGQNEFARLHLDEMQQLFLMSDYVTATQNTLSISVMNGFLEDQIVPDYHHDPKKWWQVVDRTTETVLPQDAWSLDEATHQVHITDTLAFHEYTVNFLAYVKWDPTQMYNHITNDWGDKEKEIPFDVRQPHSHEFMLKTLREFMETNPKTDVVRFTTFFYHFTLFFNDKRKEKFVDWFGYGSSVSPAALEAFEAEKGYRLYAEDFITNGSYNSTFMPPTQKYLDYIDFQSKFVALRAKELVDIVHEYGKEAIMFLGDNWIGTEPYGEYFEMIGLDGVVGSVGGGTTLRLISDIPHVKYTEGRFLPYFFPDTFFEGNDDAIVAEAVDNWVSARRALMRSPLNRIGYGGYLSLAYKFPRFVGYIEKVTDEFRHILDNVEGIAPLQKKTVAILNAFGPMRTWQSYMVAHALHYKQIYSYFGILESLSGMDMNVEFISFDMIKDGIPEHIDLIINAGDAMTSFSGAHYWDNPEFVAMVRAWIHEGHGFIGVGEPSAFHKGGRFLQLSDVLGVDKEIGYTLSTDKYYTTPLESHFITEDATQAFWYGEQVNNIYANNPDTEIIAMDNENVTLAAHQYGKGRAIYMMGLPYSMENTRILYRSIYYALGEEDAMKRYYVDNICCEINVYPESGKVAVLNNTNEEQTTNVYDQKGTPQTLTVKPSEIVWGDIHEESIIFNR